MRLFRATIALIVIAASIAFASGSSPAGAQALGDDNPYPATTVSIGVTMANHMRIGDACGGPEFQVWGGMKDHDPDLGMKQFDWINNKSLGLGAWAEKYPGLSFNELMSQHPPTVTYKAPLVFARYDLWEIDDIICGGGNDHIDLSPVKGKTLKIEVFTETHEVLLRASDKSFVKLGKVPVHHTLLGFSGSRCWGPMDANGSIVDIEICVTISRITTTSAFWSWRQFNG